MNSSRSTSGPAGGGPLDGRVVVVAGGAGFLGGHVVRGLRAAGARVVVPSRRAGAPTEDDGVRTVTVRTWDEPAELTALVAQDGWRPDAVVASVGGWWLGERLLDLAPDAWRGLLESHLTGHFLVARALLPLLVPPPGGGRHDGEPGPAPAYVMLNGAASLEPMVGSGPVCIAGAGQRMLLDVLRAEQAAAAGPAAGRRPARMHEVVVLAAVAGDDRNVDPQGLVTPGAVAAAVVRTLADDGAPATVEVRPAPAPAPGLGQP